jgi:hypothetical protein
MSMFTANGGTITKGTRCLCVDKLVSCAGQKIPHMLINASDLFFRGPQIALSGKTPFDVIETYKTTSREQIVNEHVHC